MLLDGFTNGVKLYYHGPRMPLDTTNLKSVLFNTDVAISKVKNEIILTVKVNFAKESAY